MVRVEVKSAMEKLKGNFKQLDNKQIARAASNAINRSLNKGRTMARKAVKDSYNIPQKNLDGVNKINSNTTKLTGYIAASATPIPMDAFAPKFENTGSSISISKKGVQKIKDRKRKKKNAAAGVSIEVKKGERKTVPYAFMNKNMKPRVFARGQYPGGGSYGFIKRNKRIGKGGNDTPVKPLVSVTVHAAVINEKVEREISNVLEPHFNERFEHELNYQLSKMKS